MAEWKDFSLRSGQKSNILGLMYFILTFLFIVLGPLNVFAQNTQIPEASPEVPVVTLEAKIVQIVLNDEHRQGVDWEAIVSDFHSLQLKKEGNPVWADKKYRLSVGEVSNEDFTVLLEALDTVGRVSQGNFNPLILKKDEPQSLDVSPDQKNLPTINLNLFWFNSPAGGAKLKVDSSFLVLMKDSSQPNSPVNLNNKTEVDLKDNTTLVMGGFMHEDEITKTHKFPLLGDLPLLGLVFRKQGKLMQKTETIIFLTMHTGAVVGLHEEQK